MINRLDKLRNPAKKSISITDQITKTFLSEDQPFPLVLTSPGFGMDLKNWISSNKEQFEQDLLKLGALLFRNFKISTIEKFEELMSVFPQKPLSYQFRSSPRFELSNNVYVSTTYPEDQSINMHSENSYAPEHPDRIVFCCIVPATEKGETPIADNRLVLSYLSEQLKAKFSQKGIQYRRNLNGLLGLPWQEVFQSSDKAYVASECVRNGMNYHWISESELVLTWQKKAIWQHPVSKEMVWFNHGLFFNKYAQHDAVLKSVGSDLELPSNTYFGDGSEISRMEIEEIQAAYDKATVKFQWEKGDVLYLDNLLFSHGRNPYKGERKIIVSLC